MYKLEKFSNGRKLELPIPVFGNVPLLSSIPSVIHKDDKSKHMSVSMI